MSASIEAAGHSMDKMDARLQGKDTYRAQFIRYWAKEYCYTGELPKYHQGQHKKTATVITDLQVQHSFKTHLRGLKDFDRTPHRFMTDLNSSLLAEIENAPKSICVETARIWMRYLGFSPTKLCKSYYTDEHERPDNVDYRDSIFLPKVADYEKRMAHYILNTDGTTSVKMPVLAPGEKRIVMVTHDESTFYSNECKNFVWMENG